MLTPFFVMPAISFARRKAPCTLLLAIGNEVDEACLWPLPIAGKIIVGCRWVFQCCRRIWMVDSGRGDVTVFSPFAAMDMKHVSGAVDIRDFQMDRFVETETAGVDGGQVSVIVGRIDAGQEVPHFFLAEHGG